MLLARLRTRSRRSGPAGSKPRMAAATILVVACTAESTAWKLSTSTSNTWDGAVEGFWELLRVTRSYFGHLSQHAAPLRGSIRFAINIFRPKPSPLQYLRHRPALHIVHGQPSLPPPLTPTCAIALRSISSMANHLCLAASLIGSCILSCRARLTGREGEGEGVGFIAPDDNDEVTAAALTGEEEEEEEADGCPATAAPAAGAAAVPPIKSAVRTRAAHPLSTEGSTERGSRRLMSCTTDKATCRGGGKCGEENAWW